MSTPTDSPDLLLDLLFGHIRVAHKLRALGRSLEMVTTGGGGSWGLLHSLITNGSQTVPALARERPVARQHIQLLANELATAGLVRFTDNPAHRRSKLVEITDEGRRRYEAQRQAALSQVAAALGPLPGPGARASRHTIRS
jgi:hypothetical protein